MMTKPMSAWKVSLLFLSFILVLTSFRLIWIWQHEEPVHPDAEHGVVDVSNLLFADNDTITLDGQWTFYPNTFLSPNEETKPSGDPQYIRVPSSFNDAVGQQEIDTEAFGYGTYKLTIELPDDYRGLYGIRLNKVHTAADVYVDGQPVLTHGKVSSDPEAADGKRGPTAGYFQPQGTTAELMIHVSNYGHPLEGGLIDSVQIGTDAAISKLDSSSRTLQLVVAMIFFLHGIYALILYLMGRGIYTRELLFFGLLVALHGFTILIDDDIVLQLPISYIAFGKLTLLLFISILMALLTFIKAFFNKPSKVFRYTLLCYVLLCIIIIVMPFAQFSILSIGLTFFYLWVIALAFIMVIQEMRKSNLEAFFLLFFMISYTSNFIWGILINFNITQFPFYPFDFLISVFVVALILFHRQTRLFQQNERFTKQLQETDKKKDDFLANTSHELRNPLHSVINIAYSVLEDNGQSLTVKNKKNMELIIRVGEHMRLTLDDLLDSSRLKEHQIQLKKEAVDLPTIMSAMTDMMEFNTKGKPITFHLDISEHFPMLDADRNRVIQIMFNLLHNAVKFTEEGSVTVTAKEQNGMACITVKDTGRGIQEKDLANIFQPYEQFHQDISAYEGGTGLGLSICKELVELHGGTISIASKPDQGTAISFTIPVVSMKEAAVVESAAAHQVLPISTTDSKIEPAVDWGKQQPSVLVVDDDPVNLQVLTSLLENDYHIQTAQSGSEALDLIYQGQWDLVIADVMMPNMSGYELTATVREQYTLSELPILLLTARAQNQDIYTGLHSGANDYLVKPVAALELKARVHTLTTLKQSVHEQLKYEAAWLQAQIQPHFLFNTLNTIASMGLIDTDKMIELLDQFGNYLQKSFALHNTETVIPLTEELDLIRSYLYIEQTRFGDKITIQWELEQDLNFHLPPLSIQPILENALRHGILKRTAGGTITIRTSEEPSHYAITIIDDGVGMDASTVENLLNGTARSARTGGIGVSNIHLRLMKLYGEGLRIESTPEEGTTVRIHIPKEGV